MMVTLLFLPKGGVGQDDLVFAVLSGQRIVGHDGQTGF
jgi:hypothetical protein